MSRPETEIFVHITAPARAVDDAKYRTLAAAYLHFEATTRRPIVSPDVPEYEEWDLNSNTQGVERGRTQAEGASQPTQPPGVIQSPLMSFRSAIHNFGSFQIQQPQEKIPENFLQSSWQSPPSVVEDSMPDNDFAFPQYCTPTRILQHYTSTFGSTQLNTSPISQRRREQTHPVSSPLESTSPGQVGLGVKSNGQHQPPHEEPAMVIPQSPGERDKRRRPTTPAASAVVEEKRIASSYPSQPVGSTASFRAESEPPVSKRSRTSRDPDPGKPLTRSASDIGPQRTHRDIPSPPLLDTLEILSPAPLTTARALQPADMITDVLVSLARELDLEKRFRPASQARALRPFERGYWLVDCAAWEPDLKCSAWGFLTDYLGKGAAGWGTSCRRDEDFSWIRLYCWGGVVGHMYLVLYLMSKRRVLYTGTSWIGADGGAVVVMGARPAGG